MSGPRRPLRGRGDAAAPAARMRPPFSFVLTKENAPRPVEEKTASPAAVGGGDGGFLNRCPALGRACTGSRRSGRARKALPAPGEERSSGVENRMAGAPLSAAAPRCGTAVPPDTDRAGFPSMGPAARSEAERAGVGAEAIRRPPRPNVHFPARGQTAHGRGRREPVQAAPAARHRFGTSRTPVPSGTGVCAFSFGPSTARLSPAQEPPQSGGWPPTRACGRSLLGKTKRKWGVECRIEKDK